MGTDAKQLLREGFDSARPFHFSVVLDDVVQHEFFCGPAADIEPVAKAKAEAYMRKGYSVTWTESGLKEWINHSPVGRVDDEGYIHWKYDVRGRVKCNRTRVMVGPDGGRVEYPMSPVYKNMENV